MSSFPYKIPWEFWLAIKYVFSKKRERFTGIIIFIALFSVTLSVGALTVVDGIVTGFDRILINKILGFNPHLVVYFYGKVDIEKKIRTIKKLVPEKEIASIYPSSQIEGMITGIFSGKGVLVKGIPFRDLLREKYVNFELLPNATLTLNDEEKLPVCPAVFGKELANSMGIGLGDEINFLYLNPTPTVFGFFPKVVKLRVAGFFETGISSYDEAVIFVPYRTFLQKFHPQFYAVEIKLKNPFKSIYYKEKLRKFLKAYQIIDWQSWNKNLFTALKLEKIGLFLILFIMIVVSVFTIVAAMTMLVIEKKKDIAFLKVVGADSGNISKIFLFAGFIISSMGILMGLFLGSGILLFLKSYPIIHLPKGIYPVERLPVCIDFLHLFLIGLSALAISLLTCVFPAKRASSLYPALILRELS